MVETNSGNYLENQEIIGAGLQYIGHFRQFSFVVMFEDCTITIPNDRIEEFLDVVIGREDRAYLVADELRGRLVRVWSNSSFKVQMISHITKDRHFSLNKEAK